MTEVRPIYIGKEGETEIDLATDITFKHANLSIHRV